MNTTNQVRNIMMNEMGITKESIKADVAAIIGQVAEKEFKKMLHDGVIERLVRQEFNKLLIPNKDSYYNRNDNLRDIVVAEARRQAAVFVEANVSFALKGVD